jgi:hypothetical protein
MTLVNAGAEDFFVTPNIEQLCRVFGILRIVAFHDGGLDMPYQWAFPCFIADTRPIETRSGSSD